MSEAVQVVMRQATDAVSEPRQAPYRCLDLEIDPGVPSVSRGGQPVELRAKALTLLLFLIDQRHRIVSKEEIFERAWPGTAVVDATLAGCIQEIRKALGDDAKEPRFIRTAPRLGYRFVGPLEELPPRAATASPAKAFRWRIAAVATAVAMIGLGAAAILVPRPAPLADDFPEAGWWKLDEGRGERVVDSSGNGLTGSRSGGFWEAGVRGGALRFDGTGQRLGGMDRARILPRQDAPRTLAAWVKTDATNGDITDVLHFGEHPGPNSFDAPRLMLLPDGRPAFANRGYAGIGSDRSLAVATRSILDGQWHHLVGTLADGRGLLYVDGLLQAEATMRRSAARPAGTAETPWSIGSLVNQIRGGFRGAVDDVRIWRRALRGAEISALHRCLAGLTDIATPSQQYFFSPIFEKAPHSSLRDGQLIHTGLDYGGIQLVAQSPDCPVAGLRGSDVGQDVRIRVELLVPKSPAGDVVQAGPYFRSRAAAPGDGIIGGASAGYWVQLHSNGKVTIKCLNPMHTVAFSPPQAAFDSGVFHGVEVAAHGEALEVWLDGQVLTFDQGGRQTRTVQVPPHWERPVMIGRNDGTAGVAFSSEPLRPKAGGQQARGFSIAPY
ncbi:MAG: winged helix-turn-helix domain-containing protein [Bryobacteraceae bacterium]|nr:winged helix-turn-helix domain-containing protein [Bryobacteraceae bacterium]